VILNAFKRVVQGFDEQLVLINLMVLMGDLYIALAFITAHR